MIDHDDIDRLCAIQEEMLELLNEAGDIIRQSDENIHWDRAKAYWYAHVQIALSNNHDYLGGSMHNMQDTISYLEASLDEVSD